MNRRLRVFLAALLTGATLSIAPLLASRTIIWADESGGPGMDQADAAFAYCPDDGRPEGGQELTPCQLEWWNDGSPLPIGGGGMAGGN